MCRGKQCCRRERASDSDENRFAAAEIVEYRGDAVTPLLQGGHRIRSDGIRCAGADLIDEDQPADRRHCLDPALHRGQIRHGLTIGEPGRDEHNVPSTFTRRAVGDAQVPVAGVARL
jgi:hypothetical protein